LHLPRPNRNVLSATPTMPLFGDIGMHRARLGRQLYAFIEQHWTSVAKQRFSTVQATVIKAYQGGRSWCFNRLGRMAPLARWGRSFRHWSRARPEPSVIRQFPLQLYLQWGHSCTYIDHRGKRVVTSITYGCSRQGHKYKKTLEEEKEEKKSKIKKRAVRSFAAPFASRGPLPDSCCQTPINR